MALVFRIGQSAALIAAAAVLGALYVEWEPSWTVLLVTATAMVLVLLLLVRRFLVAATSSTMS